MCSYFPLFIFKALQTQHKIHASVLYFYFGICLLQKSPSDSRSAFVPIAPTEV